MERTSGVGKRWNGMAKSRTEVALERRLTGDANPAGGNHEECTVLKRLSVFIEHPIELLDLGCRGAPGSRKKMTPTWARPC